MIRPPRMSTARWVVFVAGGLVLVFAADMGWLFFVCAAMILVTVAGWQAYRHRSTPVCKPWQDCPACGARVAVLMELSPDRAHWFCRCPACDHGWFDPPQHTTGVVFGRDD